MGAVIVAGMGDRMPPDRTRAALPLLRANTVYANNIYTSGRPRRGAPA
jgi:hypothetical protein